MKKLYSRIIFYMLMALLCVLLTCCGMDKNATDDLLNRDESELYAFLETAQSTAASTEDAYESNDLSPEFTENIINNEPQTHKDIDY